MLIVQPQEQPAVAAVGSPELIVSETQEVQERHSQPQPQPSHVATLAVAAAPGVDAIVVADVVVAPNNRIGTNNTASASATTTADSTDVVVVQDTVVVVDPLYREGDDAAEAVSVSLLNDLLAPEGGVGVDVDVGVGVADDGAFDEMADSSMAALGDMVDGSWDFPVGVPGLSGTNSPAFGSLQGTAAGRYALLRALWLKPTDIAASKATLLDLSGAGARCFLTQQQCTLENALCLLYLVC